MSERNERVTMAVLATKLDYLISKVDSIDQHVKRNDARVDELDKEAERNKERWVAHRDVHRRENSILAVLSAAQGIAAAFIGVFVKRS